jgi:hypothetical protein
MDRISKAQEIWYHLHQAEQLTSNDTDYHPSLHEAIQRNMLFVELVQDGFQDEG